MDRAAEHVLLDRHLATGAEYGGQPSALLDKQLTLHALGANGRAMDYHPGNVLATGGVVVATCDAPPVDAVVTLEPDPLNHTAPIAGR